MKRIAVLSNAIPDAWFAPCGVDVVRRVDYARDAPVPVRAGVCAHLAYLPALLEDVDGIVLATSCDQMRRGAEWLGNPQRVFLFDVPSAPCDALLALERVRLERWLAEGCCVVNLTAASRREKSGGLPPHSILQTPTSRPLSIGIIGGHFCGDPASVHHLFERQGVGIRLWGCEGGENLGDICQRPNDAFYTTLNNIIRERNLAGLVVVRTTWCDSWRAAFVRIQETAPVPVTEWVSDGQHAWQPFPDARSATRLEAFCELLAARNQTIGDAAENGISKN